MKAIAVYKMEKTAIKETIEGLTTEVMLGSCFKPLGESDTRRIGFVPNLDGTFLSHQKDGYVLTIKEQTKSVETYLVEEGVAQLKKEFSEVSESQPNKKQLTTWKAEVTEKLLPFAVPKQPKFYKVFLRNDGIVLCEGNHTKSETLLGLIRKTLGSLPVVPYETESPVGDLLDTLIKSTSDDYFELLSDAVLVTEEERSVKLSKASLYNSEAQTLVDDGAYVTQIQVQFDGMCIINIKDDLTLTGVKYSKELGASLDGNETEELTVEYLQLVEINKVVDEIIKRLTKEK